MRTMLAAVGAIVFLVGTTGSAHRLDEYLQATTISIEKERVEARIRLTPGVAVVPIVLAGVDTNADGVISEAERRAYAVRVLGDLSLTVDGNRLRLRIVSLEFAEIAEMKEGMGEIRLELTADIPRGGASRRLIFENRHQSGIAAYLVNCLAPRDPDIRITAQYRDYRQSIYQLDYVQADVGTGLPSFFWRSGAGAWLGIAALVLFGWLALLWRRARAVKQVIVQE